MRPKARPSSVPMGTNRTYTTGTRSGSPHDKKAPEKERSHHQSQAAASIWLKLKRVYLPLALLILSVALLAVPGWYVHDAMLVDDPSPNLLLSASNANLMLSILSQAFAMTLGLLFSQVFDSLRWQLGERPGGVSASTFFTLSSATGHIPTLIFVGAKWFCSLGLIR